MSKPLQSVPTRSGNGVHEAVALPAAWIGIGAIASGGGGGGRKSEVCCGAVSGGPGCGGQGCGVPKSCSGSEAVG